MKTTRDLETLLQESEIAPTAQRRVIAQAIRDNTGHPDAETIYHLARQIDPHLGIATVYRTLKLFAEKGLVDRHDFGDGRARYEVAPESHHDHLICVRCGTVVEFARAQIEALQEEVARDEGFDLLDHRMELYGLCSACRGTRPRILDPPATAAGARLVRNLAQLAPGEAGRIVRVGAAEKLHQRLLSMGLVVGEVIRVERIAPLGDPISIRVKGTSLALRHPEAEAIVVEVVPTAGGRRK
ncbi:MAG: hypothetical protein GW783_03725 [Deltaproteobacteria bacterium]|nr:hypothetical protein [Deltaproteobacteria bacterium]OIP64263.1 MAG: hypothetical protein AUK30_07045 [Nitrospirae bacterium CG2_30_70_394]PIU80220.1 MAG: hypothetical protein COS73_00460 [Nitrospirae bacterium CG06_land_8_20_14_3_00_70_43]PIW81920.1 MAG: hypothetical protein COZ96_11395 [Nitrospirae bacterium CG_4_8_14_3_um_filter_70_85]PIX84348.1 MAG: hypothetical protein COZ33_00720 [Nitrospirae bacterium CG_4_10_14_3_um_filter_70_108]PJB95408.1 MAG: hypothetical protein CO080_07880 [Nitr